MISPLFSMYKSKQQSKINDNLRKRRLAFTVGSLTQAWLLFLCRPVAAETEFLPLHFLTECYKYHTAFLPKNAKKKNQANKFDEDNLTMSKGCHCLSYLKRLFGVYRNSANITIILKYHNIVRILVMQQ